MKMTSKVVVIPYEKYISLTNSQNNIKNPLPNDEKGNISKPPLSNEEKGNSEEELVQNNDNYKVTHNPSDKPDKNISPLDSSYGKYDDISKENNIKYDDMLNSDDITNFLPKTCQKRCKLLLMYMKKNNIKWDSLGRLVIGDECVINTHIVDLISYAINNSSKKYLINDIFKSFGILLLKINCPHSILSKEVLKNDKSQKRE